MTCDLMSSYDEDLMDNIFFQTLKGEYNELFLKAISEGCVICVPRAGCLPKYLLCLDDFLEHILVPTEELPESHFRALSGAEMKISNGIINVDHDVGRQRTVHILFHETFYTEDGLKYEVLCVERPLKERVISRTFGSRVIVLNNLRDCVDFLWTENGSPDIVENIDKEIATFLKNNSGTEIVNLQVMRDSVNSLYVKCTEVVLKNNDIKKKCKVQKHLLNNFKIAVEAYIQHSIHKKIMKCISVYTAFDDAQLNKIVRNFSDLHYKDFYIKDKYSVNIPVARLELSRISGYSTALGKIGCLKRCVSALSDIKKELTISTDDLLEILSFLIIKTNLPNWNAQLKFLKLFNFSNSSKVDESNYLITSLEAALAYVQSGISSELLAPKFQLSTEQKDYIKSFETHSIKDLNEKASNKDRMVHHFFQQIALGNLSEIKEIIELKSNVKSDYSCLNLCHPLCICEKCSHAICQSKNDAAVTVNSSDDQGLTALHIASMYDIPNVVEYLLTKEADPNVTDCEGRTPLHYAALRGHQNALLLLLYSNADINVEDNSCNTPLHLCSDNGHESCVKGLIYFSEYLGVKLKVNQQNLRGDTPLHNASRWGYLNIVNILLENGGDPTVLNKRKFSPIDYAHNVKVSQLLKKNCQTPANYIRIKHQSPVFDLEEQADEKQQSQLIKGVQSNSVHLMKKVDKILRAIENGDINLVCFYMGINVNELENDTNFIKEYKDEKTTKCHPLCVCSKCSQADKENGQDPNTNLFKVKSLNVNICDSNGYTPLHIASKHGCLDLVRVFIQNGVMVNVQTFSKLQTPLILACQNQKISVVKALLDAGCNIDIQDFKLNTALHYACYTGNTKLVEILMKYEPNVNIKNIDNKTALQEARESVSIGIINILKGGKPLDLTDF